MTKIKVDGEEIEVPAEYTLLQACEAAGAEIPRFCYHERLSIAGNCRMCLIEVKGGPPKPVASCAMNVRDLRPGPEGAPPEMFTKSKMVKKAREGVMEFLLINHPLDCPICDQGGECDLQDQAMAYGVDGSRYKENKRAVEDKYIGPLVKTIMTRCIHCTRCIRFSAEVAGVPELGATGRGEDMEITTYLEHAMSSELQGNVIDLCPVGALTSRPYAFQARPWELNKTESVDVMDAIGSAIRVDTRGRTVMRILPRLNEAVNQEWISDKTRFIWDGLGAQRLDQPYIRRRGRLTPATWPEAFAAIAENTADVAANRIAAIAGDMAGVEEIYALKSLMKAYGSPHMDCRQDGAKLDPSLGRESYVFNPSIAGIDEADAILIVGSNPRREAAVLNARIRERWRRGGLPIGLIGEQVDVNYPYEYLGAGGDTLARVASGDHDFAKALAEAKRPIVIVGQGALGRPDGDTVLALAAKIATDGERDEGWNGLAVLHTAASRVGALDIGFVPGDDGHDVIGMVAASAAGEIDVMFLLGADEIKVNALGETFVVYIGSHGDAGAHRADVILPAAAYTEKSSIFVNTEGRVQMTARAAFPPGQAREDWAVLRALSDALGKTLPFDSLAELRATLYAEFPHFLRIDQVDRGSPDVVKALGAKGGEVVSEPFRNAVDDFYLTNPIARASAVMAECSALAAGRLANAAE